MKQLIEELKSVPGVIGACIYSSRDGLLETNLPELFKADRLAAVGKHLLKLYSAGRMSFDDLIDVSLHYDESVVVARELEKRLLIFAICDPSLNHNLLTMSLNLLQEEYRHGEFVSTQPVPEVSAPLESTVPSFADGQLGPLAAMKRKLVRILGPMAGFIFEEAVATWQRQGAATDTIEVLLQLLDCEIADEAKSASYRRMIVDELQAFQEG